MAVFFFTTGSSIPHGIPQPRRTSSIHEWQPTQSTAATPSGRSISRRSQISVTTSIRSPAIITQPANGLHPSCSKSWPTNPAVPWCSINGQQHLASNPPLFPFARTSSSSPATPAPSHQQPKSARPSSHGGNKKSDSDQRAANRCESTDAVWANPNHSKDRWPTRATNSNMITSSKRNSFRPKFQVATREKPYFIETRQQAAFTGCSTRPALRTHSKAHGKAVLLENSTRLKPCAERLGKKEENTPRRRSRSNLEAKFKALLREIELHYRVVKKTKPTTVATIAVAISISLSSRRLYLAAILPTRLLFPFRHFHGW
ncbi:hypothetical protein ACLOJK_008480 [Asimina triloba]